MPAWQSAHTSICLSRESFAGLMMAAAADERGGFDGRLVSPVVEYVAESPLVSAFLPWNG